MQFRDLSTHVVGKKQILTLDYVKLNCETINAQLAKKEHQHRALLLMYCDHTTTPHSLHYIT